MNSLKLFHKYFGIFISYFAFFIFFSGTLAYYKNEISLFMKPEYYNLNYDSKDSLNLAVNYLTKFHSNADTWDITLPSKKAPYIVVSYKNDKKAFQKHKNKPRIMLDPQSGEKILVRSTYGGNFLSALHYNLWFMKISDARQIIGYISLLILVVLISGVITHKSIFKNFFRLKKNTLWKDTHILTSVSGLAIFIFLSVSGIYLVERFMLQSFYSNISSNNKELMQKQFEEKIRAKRELKKNKKNDTNQTIQVEKLPNIIPTAAEIQNIIDLKLNDRSLKNISIQKDSPKTAYIQLNFNSHKAFSENGISFEAELYDMKSTQLIDSMSEKKLSNSQKIHQFMKILHTSAFGGDITKFMFFIFGVLGIIMCVSSAILFEQRLRSNAGKYLIKFANSSVFLGMPLALGAYLLGNQLISFQTTLRHDLEIKCFFVTLILSVFISVIFYKKYSYTILSFLGGFTFLLVGIISIFRGSYNNIVIMQISIFTIFLALIFTCFGRKFMKESI